MRKSARPVRRNSSRAKTNLLIGTNNTTLSAQSLGDLNAQLAAARVQKADAEAKAKMIRDMLRTGQPIESSDILNSELIRRLAEQRVTLRAQLAEQSATLLGGHPGIISSGGHRRSHSQIRPRPETIGALVRSPTNSAASRVDADGEPGRQRRKSGGLDERRRTSIARARARSAKRSAFGWSPDLAEISRGVPHDNAGFTAADARVVFARHPGTVVPSTGERPDDA